MRTSKIYKRDNNGNIRFWWAETDEIGNWRTHSGVTTSEVVNTSEWRAAFARSKNTDVMQAEFEATAAMEKKLKTDYKVSIYDVDDARLSTIKPMLAHKYLGWQGKCFAQPKLDGMRCLATKNGLWSRSNRQIIAAPHIEKTLEPFFKSFPTLILDGELYNHDLKNDFNTIMSLARKTKPTFGDLELSKKYLQFWIFDTIEMDNILCQFQTRFQERWFSDINMAVYGGIVITPTMRIDNEEQLNLHFADCLAQGYEGQIVRLNHSYEQKRSSYLLKRKEFVDEEYELVDIEEGAGNWKGMAKRAICVMPSGKQFGAGISGTQEYCIRLLKEKAKYNNVTIQYHALTPDGVPRFPIATKFWQKEFDAIEERTKKAKDLF